MRFNQNGMTLPTVIILLAIITAIGTGMYRLVATTSGVATANLKRVNARTIAAAHGALIMQTVADSITAGTVVNAAGLEILNATYHDFVHSSDNDNASDSPLNNPDFRLKIGGVTSYGDVDFIQQIPVSGGSIEFASAYDGVGHGQTLGSGFLVSEMVHIISEDGNGGRSEIRFIADR